MDLPVEAHCERRIGSIDEATSGLRSALGQSWTEKPFNHEIFLVSQSVFRHSALLSGLVSAAELDRAAESVRVIAGGAVPEAVLDRQVADKLVEMRVITNYQADQLMTGRTKFNLGPYIVTDFIGQGGMGQVFKAEHKVMGRPVAVKLLPASKSTPEAIANFMREIRTQAKLDHPNLVRAYDAGHEGKVHYLVTEYVPGMDLRRLIRTHGPLNLNQAASVIMYAALGLDYAHQSGLIHRDVKPGNILVTPSGLAKVSDLGLAGVLAEADDDPRAGKVVGTADYLSPEQIRAPREVSKVSDIYSLGCTLYYAITGKVPFPGGTPANKARRHLEETPWHPRRFNPEINEEFVEIIADMMEKDPQDRLQSMTDVVTRLEPWASELATLPNQPLTRSRWTPPPVPTGAEDQDYAPDTGRQESSGQNTPGTDTISLTGQDTRVDRVSALPTPPPPRRIATAARRTAWEPQTKQALSIAIPVSLGIGLLLGLLVSYLF